MHKKGITEEVAKKRSRRTVKHQRGIVGADFAAIMAKRGQSAQVRTQQRLAAISKAKAEKKEKEAKRPKVRLSTSHYVCILTPSTTGYSHSVLLVPQQTSRTSQSSRQKEDGEAVDLCHYLTCVVLRMYQHYAGITKSLAMSFS